MTHLVTVTRPASRPVLSVYADGALVVAVPLSQREAIHLIQQLAREALNEAAA